MTSFGWRQAGDRYRILELGQIMLLPDGQAADGGGYGELQDALTHLRSINYREVHHHAIQDVLRRRKEVDEPVVESKPKPKRKPKLGARVQRSAELGDGEHAELPKDSGKRSGARNGARASSSRKRKSKHVSA